MTRRQRIQTSLANGARAAGRAALTLARRLAPSPAEDSLYIGLALLAGGLVAAGEAELALIIPGVVLVTAGVVFNVVAIRRTG